MKMAVGINLPYTDRPFTSKTWKMLDRLQPDEITLTSFTDGDALRLIAGRYPDALYHVRPRTGPQNQSWAETYAAQGADILSYRSWETERSLRDCLDTLLGDLPGGLHPRGCQRVTVLMGNEPTLEWAPPYPSLTDTKQAADAYARWFHDQTGVIRDRYGSDVGIAVAPAAEGDDTREMMFISEVFRAGCYAIADVFADHNYFAPNSGPPWTLEWGGRAIRAMDVIGWDVAQRGRCHNTETNDNGDYHEMSPSERAEAYRLYVAWAGQSSAYESVSLFTLPGAPDDRSKPSWWYVTNEIIDAVREARDALPDLPVLYGRTVPTTVPPAPDQIIVSTGPNSQEARPMPEQTDPMLDAVRGGQTLTADQLHAKRWAAHALPKLPAAPEFHPEWGFEGAWRKPENSWWGSPLTVYQDQLDEGNGLSASDMPAARVFTNAVVIWRPGSGAEVLG